MVSLAAVAGEREERLRRERVEAAAAAMEESASVACRLHHLGS